MAVIQDIIAALWQHDFAALADPHIVSVVYFVMFATLFLENGLLPASFLPGDSLLILAGALIAQGVMDFLPTIAILTAAASLGCWLSYTGKYRWHGSAEAYTGREVQDIPGVLAVFAERRKDSFGPYVRLMSVTLN